jgi:transmembrane sensor
MSAAQDKASIVIRETATEWVVRLAAPELSQADKVAFAAWLRASPIHVREYLNVEAVRAALEVAVQDDASDVLELLKEIPSNVIQSNVIHLGPACEPAPAMAATPQRAVPRWIPSAIAAAALLATGAVLTLFFSGSFDANTYATSIGEIRRIPLPDGSTVELNTRSRIRIDFHAESRDVHLAEGEAFFTVAKDPRRPFRVLSDSAQIRAVGTQFSVYRQPVGTVVTVLEGKVVVSPAAAKSSTVADAGVIPLSAGQQTIIDSSPARRAAPAQANAVDATRATAWRHNRLIFDNQPLSAVVAEFNRYNRQQLLIEDSDLAAQQISGVFDPDKPQGLVLFLKEKSGVRASEVSDTTLLLSR